jgi:GDPmannose 4,6-dehydratase
MKSALIVGITGQDGRCLAEYLDSIGYKVFGIASGQNLTKRSVLKNTVQIIEADLRDFSSLIKALEISNPEEVYNFGAISSTQISWKQPEIISEINGLGALRILEAIKIYTGGQMNKIKYFQASSAQIFGDSLDVPQNENTRVNPRSPYAISKMIAQQFTSMYREAYGAFACSGILYNHSCEYRGEEFLIKKITKSVARIKQGRQLAIELKDVNYKDDWGYARDYVKAMHLMLQNSEPKDYVISSGDRRSIKEVLDIAFSCVGIEDWQNYLIISGDERPITESKLFGDNSKILNDLGWYPETKIEDWIKIMIDYDLKNG